MASVAHLGHAELRVTDLEGSLRFFTDLVGLSISDQDKDRVYLRAWQDWDHHTLILKKAETPGVEHVGWRVSRPEDLEAFEQHFKKVGIDYHWVDAGLEKGQGPGLRFRTPDGMPFELYWEMERYTPRDQALASKLPSHPQRFIVRGATPRRFDHVNFLVNDPAKGQEWLTEVLGLHHRYYVEGSDGQRLGSWLSRTCISHEIALMRNRNQSGTVLHHVAYFLDSPDQLIRAATTLRDHGIKIEWGPGQHGTSGAIFLYCFEPSGNRVELWTGGFLIFSPDWQPIRWDPETGPLGLELWGSNVPETYFTYGTSI